MISQLNTKLTILYSINNQLYIIAYKLTFTRKIATNPTTRTPLNTRSNETDSTNFDWILDTYVGI